jgi:8-oxo-dGTP pyrophosphatase MutT (NUDIX family)
VTPRRHRALALAALVIAAAGCGRYYWSRPAGSLDEFNRDSAACAKEASPAYGLVIQDTYRRCLTARGWVRAQQHDPGPTWYRGIE